MPRPFPGTPAVLLGSTGGGGPCSIALQLYLWVSSFSEPRLPPKSPVS